MNYFSTNNKSQKVDFQEATLRGQAPDKGLYFPEFIPVLSPDLISTLSTLSKESIALQVIRPYVGKTIPENILEEIVADTISFDFPLVKLDEQIFALELFHGPTLAFKDVGARFMSRCLGYFVKNRTKEVTVLVATSGDTGGAVANGFHGVEGVNVVILYPSGKVSRIQEQQLTTLGKNVTAIEINGNFDDCQQLVKQAFTDDDLNSRLFLTSANSINVARWLPQQFYYFFAIREWKEKNSPIISVPSGNFGNLCAGLLAFSSGLPVQHFIAACNANDSVHQYLNSGTYSPRKAVPTLSNAMDVGNPSNFVRILELFNNELESIKDVVTSYSISDEATEKIILKTYSEKKYLLDPHGAVAYLALSKYLQEKPDQQGIFLGTAHPVKFHDTIESILGEKVEIPKSIQELAARKKVSIKMEPSFKDFRELLMESLNV